MRNAYSYLVGKPERKKKLGRTTRRWDENTTIDFRGGKMWVCAGIC